ILLATENSCHTPLAATDKPFSTYFIGACISYLLTSQAQPRRLWGGGSSPRGAATYRSRPSRSTPTKVGPSIRARMPGRSVQSYGSYSGNRFNFQRAGEKQVSCVRYQVSAAVSWAWNIDHP